MKPKAAATEDCEKSDYWSDNVYYVSSTKIGAENDYWVRFSGDRILLAFFAFLELKESDSSVVRKNSLEYLTL